jgi:hypothetical protein
MLRLHFNRRCILSESQRLREQRAVRLEHQLGPCGLSSVAEVRRSSAWAARRRASACSQVCDWARFGQLNRAAAHGQHATLVEVPEPLTATMWARPNQAALSRAGDCSLRPQDHLPTSEPTSVPEVDGAGGAREA